jgi:spermidine/putrescine-binding protein
VTARGRLCSVAAVAAVLAVLVGCGTGGGTQDVAPPPKDPAEPASGTLRVFTYEDTIAPALMKPFERQNPDLEVKTATFSSDQEAATKLAGGFDADVVESCIDEIGALQKRDLLRPIDTAGVTDWSDLAFTDAPGVRDHGDTVWVVPLSAGPEGLIYNTDEVTSAPDSWQDLFDPAYAGHAALEADYALPPIAETALALGIDDPMSIGGAELERVSSYLDDHRDQFRALWGSDSELVQLFKSGEVVIADGGQGVAQRMVDDGVPVKWIPPKEGPISWVCGLSITSKAQNLDAAYRLINWQASAEAQAIRAESGYVVTNPKAIPQVPKADRATADPAVVEHAIPETEPPHYDEWTHAFQEFQAG